MLEKRVLWAVAGLVLAAAVVPAIAQNADEKPPAAVRAALDEGDPDKVDPNDIKGERWTLDFKYSHPEPIVLLSAGGERKVYWYVIYTVTNRSKEDHLFVPQFTLITDTASIAKAGLHPRVFSAIKKNRKVPFLETPGKMHGKIRQGPDNARTSVAIFAPIDRKTDAFTILVGNLSGEYVERPLPGAEEDDPSEDEVARLRKTLALKYELPGDQWWLNLDKPVFKGKEWTWR